MQFGLMVDLHIFIGCVSGNLGNGIFLTYSPNNFLIANNVSYNGNKASTDIITFLTGVLNRGDRNLGNGIYLAFSNSNHIINNTVLGNSHTGIQIENSVANILVNNASSDTPIPSIVIWVIIMGVLPIFGILVYQALKRK